MLKVKKRPASEEEKHLDPRLQTFAKEARIYAKDLRTARDLTNASNRQKTVVGKLYKKLISEFEIKEDEFINVDGTFFSFGGAEPREEIPAAALFELFEKKRINRNQLMACLTVSKEMALKYIGADIVSRITVVTPSKSAPSIRIKKTENEERTVQIVRGVVLKKSKPAHVAPAKLQPKIKLRS